MEIISAPTIRIDRHETLAREFFRRVLDADRDDYFLTDESDLCCVVTDETPPDYVERARTRYGVDLAAEPHVLLVDLFDRLARLTPP